MCCLSHVGARMHHRIACVMSKRSWTELHIANSRNQVGSHANTDYPNCIVRIIYHTICNILLILYISGCIGPESIGCSQSTWAGPVQCSYSRPQWGNPQHATLTLRIALYYELYIMVFYIYIYIYQHNAWVVSTAYRYIRTLYVHLYIRYMTEMLRAGSNKVHYCVCLGWKHLTCMYNALKVSYIYSTSVVEVKWGRMHTLPWCLEMGKHNIYT